jgi:rhamnogalacturonyl hydrolase YesR
MISGHVLVGAVGKLVPSPKEPSKEQDAMSQALFREKLRQSLEKLQGWIEAHEYRGYEPFDGLASRLRPLTFSRLFLERILQQVVRQSPINLRPILGIKPQESTKGRGYMAWGYLQLYVSTRNPVYRDKAVQCLDWLDLHKAPGYAHHSWGNSFDFSSRVGKLPKFEPIIVWTSLIGQAYLDAFEILGDKRFLEIAESICAWILDLPREVTPSGTCLSYVAFEQRSIHNSNMLGAAMLARTGRQARRDDYLEVSKEAMQYSCARQRPDGSWYYGEQADHRWIDNFHTGYNLDSLKCYLENSGDDRFRENLHRGFVFYRDSFFEPSGRPKYYHDRAYPIDSQCAAQAVETLSRFDGTEDGALDLAIKVADWTIDHMQDRKGFFYYRRYPMAAAKTPMLHWAQATTFRAFALLLNRLA